MIRRRPLSFPASRNRQSAEDARDAAAKTATSATAAPQTAQ